MKLTLIPLLILFFGSVFNIGTLTGNTAVNSTNTAGASQQNTTKVNAVVLSNTISLSIGVLVGTLIAIAIAFSLSVLGSGFSAGTARLMVLIIGLGGLWALLSITGSPPILAIPAPYGGLTYLFLTIMYIVGTIQMIAGASSQSGG